VPTEPVTATTHAPLLVIDGDSFAHRAYHALPKTIRRSGNKGAGAILGFANVLLRLYETERPRAVLVGWDTLDQPTYRHEALPGYQSGRSFDDELVDQLDVLPSFVTACGFVCAKAPGYEADDFLAAAVAREERRGGMAVVATGDRDAYQLASERTTILQPVRAGEMARIGPAEVRVRYGVDPRQVPDFIALRGDPSDGIPGAKGIGEKTAAELLQRHGSLEAALEQGLRETKKTVRAALTGQREELLRYKQIATLQDVDVDLPEDRPLDPEGAAGAARARGMDRLAGRVGD
jgi:DNA polymerase I